MFTDPRVLTKAYAKTAPLDARIAIYAYQQDRVDLPGLVVEQLRDRCGWVVDVGCGSGGYINRLRVERPDLQLLGIDLSSGMRPHVVADIQLLPLRDGSASAILAMHMLYHVPKIDKALHELRRVMKGDGVAIISTNGAQDKRELSDLMQATLQDVGAMVGDQYIRPSARFTLDDQELVEEAFDSVEQFAFHRETVVPDTAPVVAYVDSMRAFVEPSLPTGISWADVITAATLRIKATIRTRGTFRFNNHVGLFVCRAEPARARSTGSSNTPPSSTA